MKTDVNGCSQCLKGQENFEVFQVRVNSRKEDRVQYDYRTSKGELFSCVALTVEKAREKRDSWLKTFNN